MVEIDREDTLRDVMAGFSATFLDQTADILVEPRDKYEDYQVEADSGLNITLLIYEEEEGEPSIKICFNLWSCHLLVEWWDEDQEKWNYVTESFQNDSSFSRCTAGQIASNIASLVEKNIEL